MTRSELLDAFDDLLEVAEDLRSYARDWDWKYGKYWDDELRKATDLITTQRELDDGETKALLS